MYYDERRLRANGQDHVIYDGVDLNDYFEVTAFGFNVTPSISAVTATVPDKPGEHFYSRQIGVRKGTIRLTARADDEGPLNVIDKWLQLAPLISKDSPRPLYLDSDKYLNAMLVGETPIEFIGERGSVELSFTAFDPYFHGKEHVIPLETGDNAFLVTSVCEVYPVIRVTGADSPLSVRYNETYDTVRIPTVGSAEIEINMDEMKCYSGGNFVPVDIEVTDFFTLPPGKEATVWLSSGTGTLTYEERA